MTFTWHVHNHDPDEGPGLACPERLVGECRLMALENLKRQLQAAYDAGVAQERERWEKMPWSESFVPRAPSAPSEGGS